jgi:dienelactone hydrolase
MKLRFSVARGIVGLAVAAILPSRASSAQAVVSAAEPPAGGETLPVQWIKVAIPNYGTILGAVSKPSSAGPFPTVIVFHGSHGFAREYVQLAQALSRGGIYAVAVCWFSGRLGSGIGSITPIDWPGLPTRPEPSSEATLLAIDALVEAVSALPDARADRIGLFGHSRGGGIARSYVSSFRKVRAAVLHSTGHPVEWSERASEVSAPILILHGTADSPVDGGSAVTAVQNARSFEAALRRFKKPVEAQYYEGGTHNSIFTNPAQFDKEVSEATAFSCDT